MSNRPTFRRGATVIELAMCIVVLSIALPPLIKSYAESSTQQINPGNEATAAFLADERMEQIVARRYQGTDGYSAVTTSNFPSESAGSISGFAAFARSVTVSYVTSSLSSSGSDVGYKKVRVTVTWDSGTKSLVIERIFANFATS